MDLNLKLGPLRNFLILAKFYLEKIVNFKNKLIYP